MIRNRYNDEFNFRNIHLVASNRGIFIRKMLNATVENKFQIVQQTFNTTLDTII